MNTKQSTIKEDIQISGVGLHTGLPVNMTLRPAPEGYGIKFMRVDLPDNPIVDADVDNVVDLSRGTTIAKGDVKINTIEHVMAAIAGLEIDNVLVELDGPETPIMDGSSQQFVDAILATGIKEQAADREYFEIPYNIHHMEEDRSVEMVAMPLDGYRLTVMVDYNSTVLGSQHASITDIMEFKTQIASSRTFCFLHELENLLKMNLIKGGDLNNAIVIVDKPVDEEELKHLAKLFNKPNIGVQKEGILNNIELRYQNEPARHKLLDLIGDLALVGVPIKAQVMAARPGHAANIAFARKIKKAMQKAKRGGSNAPMYDYNEPPVYDSKAIQKILPHAYPFLLVDKIIEISSKHIVGIKNVTINENFFPGHFPNNPIMPGVLQIEAMAQVGGVMIMSALEDPENYTTLFMKIESAKFKDMVVPGDTLMIRMELTAPVRRGICMMKGQIFVGNKVVTEAELMAQIVKKK
ncbi:MAG: bifunctional UDP-3-O-[3-hydroxymyristoyl] N-acetylglucosamine deacetylase/3-hydroxyacyl-ACP dehydratase [Bacteroidetes bacterium]|nr:bifunctional UDP-3-O-[3-hydroxymyristoyl] N-acetylglucosamine deacetylase/3-hydroxyacyl-ACP dehydratase [Bacteroidota bacterium]